MILFCHILKEMPNSAGFGAFNQVLSSGGSMTEARKAASEAAKSDGASSEPQYEVSVKDIFEDISLINTSTNTISSLGTYASDMSIRVSEGEIKRLKELVPENSIAYKILDGADENNLNLRRGYSFSDKQKWAIAYELQKNKSYTQKLGSEIARRKSIAESKELESRMKKSANKSAAQPLLNQIKSKGLKLGDYYNWLKSKKGNWRSEYYSKKYSAASVSAFIKERGK